MKIILIAGVPSSPALPGFLIISPPSVFVTAVLVALAAWIQNQKKKRACPWLSTALVAGSVQRGRGGDQYSQRRSEGEG